MNIRRTPRRGQGQDLTQEVEEVLDGYTGPGVWDPWMEELLERIDLKHGSHGGDPWRGACLMEAIALITGQSVSDRPVCVAEPYRNYGVRLNDSAPDDETRNRLKAIIPRIINTHPLDDKLQPITGKEIEKKNTERNRRLNAALGKLDIRANWEKAFEEYQKVLAEVG